MISIVVVGFNNKSDLSECFGSINKSIFRDFKVIFVDNSSSDHSVSYVNKKFPEVITIHNKNTGYAGGNNVGLKKAMALGSSHTLVLNPDTVIDKNCLGLLMKKANENEIIQPLVLLHENGNKTNLVNTTGNHLNFLGISYCDDYRKPANEIKAKDISAASGAAMFVPTKILRTIGLFDERFFMYHEDLDLSWRARMAGFNIRLENSALIYHKYHFSKNKDKFFYIERNRWYFILKNYEFKTILLLAPLLAINECLMILYSLASGWFLIKLKAIGSLAISSVGIILSRKKIIRKVKDNTLKDYMSSKISFSEVKVPLLKYYELICGGYFKLINKLI